MLVTSTMGFAQEKKMFDGETITVAVLAGGVSGGVSGPIYLMREEWEELTGAKVNIAEIPFNQMPTKVKTDFITGAGRYDVVIAIGWMYGDLLAGNFIIPLDDYYNDKSGKYPEWNLNDEDPAHRALYQWGGNLYGVLFDSDAWIIYGLKHLFTNPDYQKQFKEKYGYDLSWPPKTTDQYIDYSEFFNGWDWDNDGEIEYGNGMPLRVGTEAMSYFFCWLSPYVTLPGPLVDEYHNTAFFNAETMEPVINSPGAVKALEDFKRLLQSAPESSLGWDLSEGWDAFLKGNLAMCLGPGDVGAMAQEEEKSLIRGQLLAAPMPGRNEIWNRETNSWEKFDETVKVGNVIGGSWHGVISRLSKNPEASYHFLSYIAQKENLAELTKQGWTGINFGKIYDFPPEVSNGKGSAKIEDYLAYNWDKEDVLNFLGASWENLYEMDVYMEYLRIPGTPQLINSLDIHVGNALLGTETPEEALNAAAKEWNQVIDTLGRDTLKIYYQQAIGYGEEPPKYVP